MGILDHNPDLADVIRGDAHAQALIAESEAYRRQLEKRASTPAPEPRPLQPDLEAAAPYPLDALPPLMRDAAQAIAEHVQAPLALAGQCVIGAGVYLAQTRVNAPHIHHPGGMPCTMFLLTLGHSGERKSETRRQAFKIVDEAEEKARTEHRKACDEITNMAAGLKGKALEQFNAEHPLPFDPRTQYSDATYERIAGDMIRGASSASWDTDEGGQVLGGASLKADTRAATLGGLVKAFDTGAFERTRSHGNAEGSGFAYNRRLSMHLLAQAVTVASALDDPLLRGQGFLPRFLFASPPSLAGTRFLTADQLNRKAYADPRLQRYWARCEAINATPPAIDPQTGEVSPPVLDLDDEAAGDWLDFYNEVEGEQSPLGKFANLRPFAGRAGELVRRLAAVFACFEGQQQIDGECMRRATVLVRHSLAEWARYTDSEAVNPKLQQAAVLLEWLQVNQWLTFDARALQREGPRFVRKSAAQRDNLLAILVDHHQLLTSDGKQFDLNPLATVATTATAQAHQGFSCGDTLATSGDKLNKAPDVSPPVASLSPITAPANTRRVATVAAVASPKQFYEQTPAERTQ
ncbi:DUF3987 domain-containing protein [Pseudomonas sp.]|uniref:DUF3987 domain-containing protein n=1 Tax=Pseudomonas sp. TaxID=306 RepID=UPI002B8F3153|nr:DUF3987 domain-containing protein [Pseudomonas sp.]HUE93580.1 DUF3987 domain-containing protein [Pseudomonas sp.]